MALLIVQALHLLHHRLVKRHISFAEVISALVLCVPPWATVPGVLLMGIHNAHRGATRRQPMDKKALTRMVIGGFVALVGDFIIMYGPRN